MADTEPQPTSVAVSVELEPKNASVEAPARATDAPAPAETKPATDHKETTDIPDGDADNKEDNDSNAGDLVAGSEEFADSFHYATLLQITEKISVKSLLYLSMSILLLYFQIVALLGFQMRNAYNFCSADADCTVAGQYCELKIGICKDIDHFRQCSTASDCMTPNSKLYFCSTELNQTCAVNDKACTYASDCPASMFCSEGKCTNDFTESGKIFSSRSSWDQAYYFGNRTCTADNECVPDVLNASRGYSVAVQNAIESAVTCQTDTVSDYWASFFDTKQHCSSRKTCNDNSTCPVWQFCQYGTCTDFAGAKCLRQENCTNLQSSMGNVTGENNYKCPWDPATSANGICYFYGPLCETDTDCKLPGWSCNNTVQSTSNPDTKYGYCVNPNAGEPNFCQPPSNLLPLDLGALVFVCCVICINVAKDLREAIITEMKLRSRYKENRAIATLSWKILCGKQSGEVSLREAWILAISMMVLETLLFVRKYMFVPLVMAVTASVLTGQTAAGIILNGVAIFFVVDIDNLFYDFFHDKGEKDDMEENGVLKMNPRQARYLKMISLTGAVALTFALLLLMRQPQKVISAFGRCNDMNAVFRVGGLFIIICLFIGYFIAELTVPLLELCWPTMSKEKPKSLKESLHHFSVTANAAYSGKLTVCNELLAACFIILQGTAGAVLFAVIVAAWYYEYVGSKNSKYSSVDKYAPQAEKILSEIRESLLIQASYWDYDF